MAHHASRRLLAAPLALSLVLAAPASAIAQQGPGRDVNLVAEKGFFSYPQTNAKWARYFVGQNRDVTIGSCGCLLATLGSIAEFDFGSGTSLPLFPWLELYTGQTTLSFSPRYLDLFLMYGDPSAATPPADGWGYKPLPPGSCGTAPKRWALEAVAAPRVILDPVTGAPVHWTPSGLRWGAFEQGGPAAFDKIDENLLAGRPTIVVIEVPDGSGGTSLHAQLVVGWDETLGRYEIMDPAWPTFLDWAVPGGHDDATYDMWIASVAKVFDVHPVTAPLSGALRTALVLYDDPGPIELLAIGPDGRRTGFEPALGRRVRELESAEAYAFGGWTDPAGALPGNEPARFLEVSNPEDGTWRFLVTGTGDGDAPLTLSTIRGGVETVLLDSVTAVTVGSSIRYEVRYTSAGASTAAVVTDFTPEPRTNGPFRARVGEPILLDGSASFDVDGTITGHLWDFGDGSTATGAAASHAWSAPGVYPVRLTVTDASGAMGTGVTQVAVSGGAGGGGGWTTERASTDGLGVQAAGISSNPRITPDGRHVVFETTASLVPEDSNGVADVYLKDLDTGAVERVSVSSTGTEAAADTFRIGSVFPAISADGRFVAFISYAANLVPGDLNSQADAFVRDRLAGTTEIVSLASTGGAADGSSIRVAISADGRFVAFEATAANLVPGGNGLRNVYVRDRQAGTTEIASASAAGSAGVGDSARPRISDDGRFVVFESSARNLVVPDVGVWTQVYLRDRQAGTIEVASRSSTGGVLAHHAFSPGISDDGRFVVFHSSHGATVPGDGNGVPDVFVRDRQAATTTRVSVSTFGVEGNAGSIDPAVSPDGRFVAFYSTASNLVPDDTNRTGPLPSGADVFLHDRTTGTTERASLSTGGAEALPDVGFACVGCQFPSVGLAGAVAFASSATNLVGEDTNGAWDVFVRRRLVPRPVADASGPYAGWASAPGLPAHVTLDARRSFDPGGAPLTALWDFGDGTPVAATDAATPVEHAYATAGEFTVTLVVTNGTAESDPVTTTVTVEAPRAGVARTVAIPACGAPGSTVRLHARGAPLASAAGGWDFGSGPPPSSSAALPDTSLPVTFSGGPGARGLTGTVDSVEVEGGIELSTRVVVALPADLSPGAYSVSVNGATATPFAVPCPPETELRPRAAAGGPYQGVAGVAVSFDGAASSAPGGGGLLHTWDFGDGETGTGWSPQHVYAEAGTYVVTLVVNDGIRSSIPMVRGGSFARVVVAPADPGGPGAGDPSGGCGCGQGGAGMLALFFAGLALLGPLRRGGPDAVRAR